MSYTTWRTELQNALETNSEIWNDIISIEIEDGGLDKEFDDSYGTEHGCPFTVWTSHYVYFPICYDGSEWVGCAPRFPNGQSLSHQGG
jgi:hypothetical protein